MGRYKYLVAGISCFLLIGLMGLTYSKFTYEKELSGSIVTVSTIKSLYSTLNEKSYTLDTNVNFASHASSTNGQGLMMRNGTQSTTYPILYYRGNIADNNVVYAGFCWLIVRTTETGGVKLIYNGKVNDDGSCNNYSNVTATKAYNGDYASAYINRTTTYRYNSSYTSPVYTGYMYNDTTSYYDLSTGYINTSSYKSHLSDNTVNSGTGRHTQNLKDSNMKSVIDTWYSGNIDGKTEENLLEDTVWCVDRSVTSSTYSIDRYSSNYKFFFGGGSRFFEYSGSVSPDLTCSRNVDKFTVESSNGNGDLTYSIGMLTADEIGLAGNVIVDGVNLVTTYLTIPNHYYWTISPCDFNNGGAGVFSMLGVGLGGANVYDGSEYYGGGVRPSVSLGLQTMVLDGNGTFESPYVVGQ